MTSRRKIAVLLVLAVLLVIVGFVVARQAHIADHAEAERDERILGRLASAPVHAVALADTRIYTKGVAQKELDQIIGTVPPVTSALQAVRMHVVAEGKKRQGE